MAFRRKKESHTGRRLLLLGGAGIAAMYFFDPQMGRTRRAKFAEQMGAFFRRGARRAERTGRYMGGQVYGAGQRVAHTGEDRPPPNDQTLVAKIESEVLSRNDYPKGKIAINAEDGVVHLRGELEDEGQIASLEQDVRKVTGVVDVRNLLHLPGGTAPNKESAVKASRRR
ncbi:MAG: BON domain-containing protein [Actinomycetota bacterium]|nr:BON domain-containing protein [Actinomycetota bacterium]